MIRRNDPAPAEVGVIAAESDVSATAAPQPQTGAPELETSAPSTGGAATEPPADGPVPTRFSTRLSAFAGPLDLLLYLIHKNEIDILDIPVATVLEQYLDHVFRLQRCALLDLNDAGDFLVMAARLMEIKSRLLLPAPETAAEGEEELEEELEDPRANLVEQLLAYKEIKERALLLEEVHLRRGLQFDRIPPEEIPEPEAVLDLGEVSVWDLSAAFQRVFEELRSRQNVKIIEFDEVPVEDVIRTIKGRFDAWGSEPVTFASLFPPGASVGLLIAHFLAILEMARLQLLVFEQSGLGEILISRKPGQ